MKKKIQPCCIFSYQIVEKIPKNFKVGCWHLMNRKIKWKSWRLWEWKQNENTFWDWAPFIDFWNSIFLRKKCVLLISSSTIWPSIILIFKVFIWLCARIKIESSDFNIFIHQFSIFIHGGSKKVLVDVIVVMFYHKIVYNSSKNSAKMRYNPRYPKKVIGTFESFVSKTSDQSKKPPVNR